MILSNPRTLQLDQRSAYFRSLNRSSAPHLQFLFSRTGDPQWPGHVVQTLEELPPNSIYFIPENLK